MGLCRLLHRFLRGCPQERCNEVQQALWEDVRPKREAPQVQRFRRQGDREQGTELQGLRPVCGGPLLLLSWELEGVVIARVRRALLLRAGGFDYGRRERLGLSPPDPEAQ